MMNILPIPQNPSPILKKVLALFSIILFVVAGLILFMLVDVTFSPQMSPSKEASTEASIIVGPFLHIAVFFLVIGLAMRDFHNWKRTLGHIFLSSGTVMLISQLYRIIQHFFNQAQFSDIISISTVIGGILLSLLGILCYALSMRTQTKETVGTLLAEMPDERESLVGRRFAAALIDYSLYFSAFWFLVMVVGQEMPSKDPMVLKVMQPSGLVMYLMPWIWIAYFPLMEAYKGETVGKALLNLQVVCENPDAHPLRVAVARRAFDLFELLSLGLIGLSLIRFTKHHKRFGDFIGGSRVVRR